MKLFLKSHLAWFATTSLCRQYRAGTIAIGVAATITAFVLLTFLLGCVNVSEQPQAGSRDYLLGWFKRTGGDSTIPVFKREGMYFSVCRGFEVPLKECPEGLEWAITPSSMTGTKIGGEAASKTPYLSVIDAQARNFSDGRYGIREKEVMVRIEKPTWVQDAKTPPPRTLNNLVGWYQPVWFPWVKIEIRKEGDRFFTAEREFHDPGIWRASDEKRELTPSPDTLGFTGFERKRNHRLVYNEALKRVEIVMTDGKRNPSAVRMPLARVPAPSLLDVSNNSPPKVRIGIPSWQ